MRARKHLKLFDEDVEVRKWSSLYEDESTESWGIFQKCLKKRVRKRMEICLSLNSSYKAKKVLDIGCGSGHYAMRIFQNGGSWFGLDISVKMLEQCKKRLSWDGYPSHLVAGSFLDLPIASNQFDLIFLIGVLSYLRSEEIGKGLKEAYHVLKPSGILITQSISFDIITWIRSRLPLFCPRKIRLPGPLYSYSPRVMKRTLKGIGFSIIDILTIYKYGIYPLNWIYVAEKP